MRKGSLAAVQAQHNAHLPLPAAARMALLRTLPALCLDKRLPRRQRMPFSLQIMQARTSEFIFSQYGRG